MIQPVCLQLELAACSWTCHATAPRLCILPLVADRHTTGTASLLPCRPCPLAQQYIGVTVKKPLQRFQLMNEICYTKVGSWAGCALLPGGLVWDGGCR